MTRNCSTGRIQLELIRVFVAEGEENGNGEEVVSGRYLLM